MLIANNPVWNCAYPFGSLATYMFLSITVLLALGALFLVCGRKQLPVSVGVGCVLGAALFNTAQRLTTNCVFDYFSFLGLFNFNVADVALLAGVIVVVFFWVEPGLTRFDPH